MATDSSKKSAKSASAEATKPVYALVGADSYLQTERLAEILTGFPKDLQRIAAEHASEHAASWLMQIEEVRAALEVNINRKVASDALFMSMSV